MSDSISVLLHAAARGARLQWSQGYGKWINPFCNPKLNATPDRWRIHPKDTHLRYGPISSVLYEAAKNPPVSFYDISFKAEPWLYDADDDCAWEFELGFGKSDKLVRSLFLLFVAESLVEEGL